MVYDIDIDGKGVMLYIFVNVLFDKFVVCGMWFWNVSGIDFKFDVSGLKVDM